MRKTIALSILLILIIGISTGCGTGEVSPVHTASPTEIPKVHALSVSHCQGESGPGGGWTELEAVASAYEARTGVKVELLYVPVTTYPTWLDIRFAGGLAPDVVFTASTDSARYYLSNWIVDMGPWLEKASPYTGKPWRDSFYPGILSGSRLSPQQDVWLGVPLTYSTVVFYYNTTVFAEAGIHQAPANWTELLQAAETIRTRNPTEVPFSVMNSIPWNLYWIMANYMDQVWYDQVPGMDIITKDGVVDMEEQALAVKTGTMDPADSRFVDFFRFLKRLSKHFNRGYNVVDMEYETLFNQGKAAMTVNGHWFVNQAMLGGYPIKYDIAPIPYVDHDTSEFGIDRPMRYAIGPQPPALLVSMEAKDTGRLQQTIDLLQFWTDPQTGGKAFFASGLHLPAIKDIELTPSQEIVMKSVGEEVMKLQIGIHAFTPEESQMFHVMLQTFLEDETTAEDFVAKWKPIVLEACDIAIQQNTQWRVKEFLSS